MTPKDKATLKRALAIIKKLRDTNVYSFQAVKSYLEQVISMFE